MQHRISEHHAKHQHRRYRHTTGHELVDAPPYANIYGTSNGSEAMKPKVQRKVPDCEYAKNGNRQAYEEDIDAEAEEFIALEHKKFELSKLMSMKGESIMNEAGKRAKPQGKFPLVVSQLMLIKSQTGAMVEI
ncbi:hypothetical protein F0562_034257 [Nyssa sinensis]|uniref:Uncharacterized protein n=1 Tax=Nyssa sinensis TaxID=561372 RepID=A0A5J5AF83_9ASTE|nr:hypothetical protein F0562_034257 [Nyssa sinensis]